MASSPVMSRTLCGDGDDAGKDVELILLLEAVATSATVTEMPEAQETEEGDEQDRN